jgi:hypothetical protein
LQRASLSRTAASHSAADAHSNRRARRQTPNHQQPPGATVEFDGIVVGTTPFERDFPGGYFHRAKTAIGKRLEHPMVVRVSLAGYATKEMMVSQGPMTWIGLNGRHHGECWLLKADRFDVDLDALDDVYHG